MTITDNHRTFDCGLTDDGEWKICDCHGWYFECTITDGKHGPWRRA